MRKNLKKARIVDNSNEHQIFALKLWGTFLTEGAPIPDFLFKKIY